MNKIWTLVNFFKKMKKFWKRRKTMTIIDINILKANTQQLEWGKGSFGF